MIVVIKYNNMPSYCEHLPGCIIGYVIRTDRPDLRRNPEYSDEDYYSIVVIHNSILAMSHLQVGATYLWRKDWANQTSNYYEIYNIEDL